MNIIRHPRIIALALLVSATSLSCNRAGPASQYQGIHNMSVDEKNLDNPKMIWGQTTNLLVFPLNVLSGQQLGPTLISVRAGIDVSNGVVVMSGSPPKLRHSIYVGHENVSSNLACAFLPAFDQRFTATVIDSNGAPLPKTSDGMRVGRPIALKANTPWQDWRNENYFTGTLWPQSVDMYEFDPARYFRIERPGLYRLKIVQRLIVVNTNQFLETLTLPPVSVDVKVE